MSLVLGLLLATGCAPPRPDFPIYFCAPGEISNGQQIQRVLICAPMTKTS